VKNSLPEEEVELGIQEELERPWEIKLE